MPSFDPKDYMNLSIDRLRDEHAKLRDVLSDCEAFRPTNLMLVFMNDSNKTKLRERMEEIRRQARMKGTELGRY